MSNSVSTDVLGAEDGGDSFKIERLDPPEDFFSFDGGDLFETERLDPKERFFGFPWFFFFDFLCFWQGRSVLASVSSGTVSDILIRQQSSIVSGLVLDNGLRIRNSGGQLVLDGITTDLICGNITV